MRTLEPRPTIADGIGAAAGWAASIVTEGIAVGILAAVLDKYAD